MQEDKEVEQKQEITTTQKMEIVALRDDAIAGFMRHREDFAKLEEGYINIIPEKKRLSLIRRGKSSLTPNLIMPKVMMVTRDVMKSFFSNDELAELTVADGASDEDKIVNEALIEELKEYSRETALYTKTKPVVRDTLIYGTTATKVYWSVEANTAKVEQGKIDTVFLDPYAPNAQDIRFLVHRVSSMTIGDLKKKFKDASIDWEAFTNESMLGESSLTPQDVDIGDYQRVEFFDVYRKKGEIWYLTSILNDDNILQYDLQLKDGLPFIITTIDPQFIMMNEPITPVRAYGASFIAPLLPLQNEYTIKRNQQIDAIDTQLNQRFVVNKTSGLREEDLNSNRKKITVDDVNSIKELPIPRLNDSIFDIQQLSREAEEISGVTKFTQSEGANNRTAREIMALESQGSSVSDDINRAFNESFFRILVQRLAYLIYKYKESERFIGIDRSRPLKQKVSVNVGVGSTNKILALENSDNAIGAVSMAMQTFMGLQDGERLQKYSFMLDALIEEKLKLLGQNKITERVEQELQEQQEQIQEQEMQNGQMAMEQQQAQMMQEQGMY